MSTCLGRGASNGHQDVTLLPKRATFYTTFHKNCGRVQSIRTTTCLKDEDEGKQGHTPCEIHLFSQMLFPLRFESHGDHNTATKVR